MRGDKKTKLLAKQLFKLSLRDGQVSSEQVAGVLGYIEQAAPRHALALLKLYQQAIVTELAKSHARVEHAGPISAATLQLIASAMTKNTRAPSPPPLNRTRACWLACACALAPISMSRPSPANSLLFPTQSNPVSF